MTDIIERLRGKVPMAWGDEGFMLVDEDAVLATFTEAADEIERLREAIRQADYVFELLAPENHSQTSEAEMASLLFSVGEKLSGMVAEWDSAALVEKE